MRRVSWETIDVAGGDDPVEGAVNGDPQVFFCFFFSLGLRGVVCSAQET